MVHREFNGKFRWSRACCNALSPNAGYLQNRRTEHARHHSAWLELDLGKPTAFSRVLIDECDEWGKRIRKFELQYKDGEAWKTFHQGTTIGPGWTAKFEPVTAQYVRLNILKASEGPTIWEFKLFAPKKK
jgi:hypothetical protein